MPSVPTPQPAFSEHHNSQPHLFFLLREGSHGSGFPPPAWMAFNSLTAVPWHVPQAKRAREAVCPAGYARLAAPAAAASAGDTLNPSALPTPSSVEAIHQFARVRSLALAGICSICKGQEEERELSLPPGSHLFFLGFFFFSFLSSAHKHQAALQTRLVLLRGFAMRFCSWNCVWLSFPQLCACLCRALAWVFGVLRVCPVWAGGSCCFAGTLLTHVVKFLLCLGCLRRGDSSPRPRSSVSSPPMR